MHAHVDWPTKLRQRALCEFNELWDALPVSILTSDVEIRTIILKIYFYFEINHNNIVSCG